MFSDWIRRKAFWALDCLRGNAIKKEYDNIKNYYNGYNNNQDALLQLLNHAKTTVPYYRNIKDADLICFPVLTKTDIKKNYEKFQSMEYVGVKKHCMQTSGSTGIPFKVVQDKRKRNRVLAELIYFNEILGQKIGQKFCFFRVWTEHDKTSKLTFFAKNEVPIDISHLDDNRMEELRTLLKKDKKIHELLGYASTHKRLLQYVTKMGDDVNDFNIKLIVSGSEMMEPAVRRGLQKCFGCTVVSRYSNQENGVLGQQFDETERYKINSASYYIELLNLDSDTPVEKGALGRVVVTDLFNFAMPLIRYDTGDLARESMDSTEYNKIFECIEGRRVNACYNTNGEMISPFVFDKAMEEFFELEQFQFIQEDRKQYRLIINDPKNRYKDLDFKPMIDKYFGSDANVNIERVDSIPCCDSNKFMQMICNYHREK